jgi:hypothetical protein
VAPTPTLAPAAVTTGARGVQGAAAVGTAGEEAVVKVEAETGVIAAAAAAAAAVAAAAAAMEVGIAADGGEGFHHERTVTTGERRTGAAVVGAVEAVGVAGEGRGDYTRGYITNKR